MATEEQKSFLYEAALGRTRGEGGSGGGEPGRGGEGVVEGEGEENGDIGYVGAGERQERRAGGEEEGRDGEGVS